MSANRSNAIPHSIPRFHLVHIVLEPTERSDLALVNDDAVANQARLGVAGARDSPVSDETPRRRAELGHFEDLSDLRLSELLLLEGRLEQPRHRPV